MLNHGLLEKVLFQAKTSACHSWEYGTIFEALLEYYNPSISIFNKPFPDGQIPAMNEEDVPALKYVKSYILTDSDQLCEGNGSSSDPTSLLIPALLLSRVQTNSHDQYFSAVHRQLAHLTVVPRFPNNAISHRDAYPSLWADFIYMVPPALAYYSVFTNDTSYMKEAVRQCKLYCEVLRTESGCWKHIVNAEEGVGRKRDEGLWSTSNGWAVAGMSRVLAAIRKSKFASEMRSADDSLVKMIQGVTDGAMVFDTDSSGLLRNRLDDGSWFGEAAGTALIAATVFRLAVLEPSIFGQKTYMDWALKKMYVVERCVDQDTGVVAQVVNPTSDEQRTPLDGVSPEAQAFIVLLFSAWRDWKAMDS